MDDCLGPSTWLLLALGLALFELLGIAPFVACFFALGASATAGVQLLHFADAPWAAALTFFVASAVPLLVVRPKLLAWATRRARKHPIDTFVGQPVRLLQPLAPQESGAGTLRGARWQVRNVGPTPLLADARPQVVALDGLTLQVTAHDKDPAS